MKILVGALALALAAMTALQVAITADLVKQVRQARADALRDTEVLRYDMVERIEGRAVSFSVLPHPVDIGPRP